MLCLDYRQLFVFFFGGFLVVGHPPLHKSSEVELLRIVLAWYKQFLIRWQVQVNIMQPAVRVPGHRCQFLFRQSKSHTSPPRHDVHKLTLDLRHQEFFDIFLHFGFAAVHGHLRDCDAFHLQQRPALLA